MAVEGILRPGEEAWQGALDNLSQRFAQIDASSIAQTLREHGGHAGHTAQALRKLAAAGTATANGALAPAPSRAAAKEMSDTKENRSPCQAAKKATSPVVVKDAAVPTKAEPTATLSPAKAAGLAPQEAPPPPDSKLIIVAALQGDVQQLRHLINAGTDLNGRYTGRPTNSKADKIIDATALHLVVTMGKADVADVLLRHGADFEAKMRRGIGPGKPPEEQYAEMTALHLAAMEGHTNIVEMLLAYGADTGAQMQLIERSGDEVQERAITPLEIAREMASKGHARDSVISLLSR